MRDEIYKEPVEKPEKFEFSEKVANVFNDMIRRSVPFYEANQLMTSQMAFEFYKKESIIFDLGCSTGTSAQYLDKTFDKIPYHYTGIDNSAPMIERARNLIFQNQHITDFVYADIETYDYQNAGVIIANYTFQFIPPERRQKLLINIYNGLNDAGVLLLSEKVTEKDPILTEHFSKMHHNMKKAHGYSDLEIIQKRDAIEDVLIPNETLQNFDILKNAGFKSVSIYHKWYNFASYIAVK